MEHEKEISGKCPLCDKNTKFRELTLTENLASMGSFIGGFLSTGLAGKAKQSAALINDFSDSRRFPNYKCGGCGKEVMQCNSCTEIIPYAHDGTSHICGANEVQVQKLGPADAGESTDLISKLERLAALREKGFLTDKEFKQQKKNLMS